MSIVEDTITKLESLSRISNALHRDIEGLLEDLKRQPQELSPSAERDYRSWSAITGVYSLEEFQKALTEAGGSIAAANDIAHSRIHGAKVDVVAPVVALPYAQEAISPISEIRDVFHAAKPFDNTARMREQAKAAGHVSNTDSMRQTAIRRALPIGHKETTIHTAGRQPQPIGEAVEELLNAVEANTASQRGPKSPGEILTQYLSPAILNGGRGFVQPGQSGLKRYHTTLTVEGALENARIGCWPNGFYAATKDTQDEFFVATPNFLVLVYGLTGSVSLGVVLRSSGGDMISQDELSLGERLQLSQELEKVLLALSE